MFSIIFLNRLKCIIRDRVLMFWTLAFPLILATFFNLALSNITKQEVFNTQEIAVVDSAQYRQDTNLQNFLVQQSEDSVKLFNIHVVTRSEAEKMLKDDKVIGYINVGETINLTVKQSGFEQTIIKTIFDEYSQTVSIVNNIAEINPAALQNGILEDLEIRKIYTRDVQIGTKDKPDSTVNYFYSLIAMACLYGAFFGMREITDIQADLSKIAARLNIAPIHKGKVLLSGMCASYMVSLANIVLLIIYMVFALGIDFGNQIGYIILTCLAGCACGISFGAFISAIIKKGEGIKTAILIVSTMTASFLSGMMVGEMKYIIQQNIPVLVYINPVALITDALYALYYYDTHTRFFTNISLLGGFTVLFVFITYLIVRRQKYDSI